MAALETLFKYKKLILYIHIVIFLAMLPGMSRLENDNAPEVFFTRDAESLLRYHRFRDNFGAGHAIRIAAGGPSLWTESGLRYMWELEDRIGKLEGVEAVVGLRARHNWKLWQWPPLDIPAFRLDIQKDGLETGAGWISCYGEIVTTLVLLQELSPKAKRKLLAKIEHHISQTPEGLEVHLSGLPVLHLQMNRSLVKMASRFLPLLLLMAMTILAVVFARGRFVLIPLLFVLVCQGMLFGIMGYAGVHLNLVNIILAPVLFVICLATAVHILMAFRRQTMASGNHRQAVLDTYAQKAKPIIWTGITTLTAFGSLALGNSPPVRTLGMWSAAGIVIMTVLAFTLYPALLLFSGKIDPVTGSRPFEAMSRRLGRRLASLAVNNRRRVWIGMGTLVGLAVIGMNQLEIDDNMGRYLPPHHPTRMEMERLERKGIGVFAAELVLSRDGGFLDPESQQKLARLADMMRAEPLARGVMSSGDLVESAIRYVLVEGKVTEGIRWLAMGLLQTSPDSRPLLRALLTPKGETARVTFLLPMLSFHRAEPLFQRIEASVKTLFPDSRFFITGQYPLILQAQKTLLSGLAISLSITLCCVGLVFLLLIRSFRLGLRLLIPNIWPIVLVFGGMGLLGVPMDSVSVMTASIVLGLAVDDTLHTMGYFLALSANNDPQSAIIQTLERTAPAHILTSIILSSGFFACYFSDLLPVSRMGILSAIAILLALAGDLILIPAIFGRPRPLILGRTSDKMRT
jgi:predicted RND superfamily exporter protein